MVTKGKVFFITGILNKYRPPGSHLYAYRVHSLSNLVKRDAATKFNYERRIVSSPCINV